MKYFIVRICILLIFLVLLASKPTRKYQEAQPPATLPSDHDQISLVVDKIDNSLRANDLESIQDLLTSAVSTASDYDSSKDIQICSLTAESIEISDSKAIVLCHLTDCEKRTKAKFSLPFEKVGLVWKVQPSPASKELFLIIADQIESREYPDPRARKDAAGRRTILSSPTVLLTNNMLINIRHPWTPSDDNVYLLNAGYTSNNVSRRLVSDNVKLVIDGYYLDAVPENAIGFHLDNDWKRIIYAKRNGNWVRAYGSNDGDYIFSNPKGLAVDIAGTIFCVDAGTDKVVKLWFDNSDNGGKVKFSASYSIPGVQHLVDVAIDQTGSIASTPNPTNDNIWVADDMAGKLIKLGRDGTIRQTVTGYTVGGSSYPLTGIRKVQTQETGNRLAIIDGSRRAFVTLTPPSPGSNTATAIYSTEFNASSDLSAIGQDINNEWWVGDQLQRMYHHFTPSGQYIASYSASTSPSGQFNSPVSASKSPYYVSGATINRSQYFYTSDIWGTSTGERAFFPGADVINMNVVPTTTTANCTFTATNQCRYNASIINTWTGSVAATIATNSITSSGTLTPVVSNLSSYVYKLRVEVKPYYNSSYGSDSVQWLAKDYWFITAPVLSSPASNATNQIVKPTLTWNNFPGVYSYTVHIYNPSHSDDRTITVNTNSYTLPTNLYYDEWYTWEVTAVASGITSPISTRQFKTRPWLGVSISGPSCVDPGASGTWTANVSGSVGTVTYSWCWMTVGPCIPIGTNSSSVTFAPNSSITLKCTVTDGLQSTATKSITYGCSPPPSCPFVYTWDGNKFQEDNNILPQSEYPQYNGVDVTDYYRLLKPLRVNNGKYALQIREFENELSFLDQFKLLAIDHPAGTKIDVDANSGEVYQYATPFSLRRALLRGFDITSQLAAMDTNVINVNSGDTLNLSLSYLIPSSMISSGKNNERTISSVGGGSETAASSPPKEQKTAYIVNDRAPATVTGPPATVNLAFRQRKTLIFKPMSLDSLSSWKIIWSQKAAVDYVNFGLNITPLSYTLRELPLASARHSTNGNALSKLTSQDSVYEILTPGQTIELRYNSLPPPADGTVRSFILVSRGRYEKISDSTFVPQSLNPTNTPDVVNFSLNANYPNPFNPTTNIQFELPQDGHVMLAVFNTLGQEVTRLVDQNLERGLHNISWDARGNASGIYFCRFVVTDNSNKIVHQETQKMLLMR